MTTETEYRRLENMESARELWETLCDSATVDGGCCLDLPEAKSLLAYIRHLEQSLNKCKISLTTPPNVTP